jgi:hypothetical protein
MDEVRSSVARENSDIKRVDKWINMRRAKWSEHVEQL